MVLKKVMRSQDVGPVILRTPENVDKLFPPGFSYSLDGIIYTVVKNITKDAHQEMRRLKTSAGDQEDVMIESIRKDLNEEGCKILSEGNFDGEKK